jgi:hypothetical protein
VDAEPSEAGLDGSTEKKEASVPGKRTVVLVSSGQLIPTLTKCLLFRLDPWIHPLNGEPFSFAVCLLLGQKRDFDWLLLQGGRTLTKCLLLGSILGP